MVIFALDLHLTTIVLFEVFLFFFKQKTAYEMRISDWSSDVCSSDLCPANTRKSGARSLSRLSFGTKRALTLMVSVRMVPAQPPSLVGVKVPMMDMGVPPFDKGISSVSGKETRVVPWRRRGRRRGSFQIGRAHV